jgi:hypothetical protein
MEVSVSRSWSQPSRIVALVTMLMGLVAAVIVVGAPHNDPLPPAAPSAEVVRDLVEIQQQLGGSIVKGSTLESLASSEPPSPPLAVPPPAVATLREAAWQLDKSAYHLESADLYDQADTLRDIADEFRQEARNLKAAAEKPE